MARKSRIGAVKKYLEDELKHYSDLEESAAQKKQYEDAAYFMDVRVKIEKALVLCSEENQRRKKNE